MFITVRLLLRGGSGQCRCLSYTRRGFRCVCSGRLHRNDLCMCVFTRHDLLSSATEYHLGLLKAKLAKYRAQLLEPTGKAGAKVRFGKQSIAQSYLSMFWLMWVNRPLSQSHSTLSWSTKYNITPNQHFGSRISCDQVWCMQHICVILPVLANYNRNIDFVHYTLFSFNISILCYHI